MKDNFIFVEYNGVSYPSGYNSNIKEIVAHFDKNEIEMADNSSLHTEYSYGKRKFDSDIINKYVELKTSHKNGIP